MPQPPKKFEPISQDSNYVIMPNFSLFHYEHSGAADNNRVPGNQINFNGYFSPPTIKEFKIQSLLEETK